MPSQTSAVPGLARAVLSSQSVLLLDVYSPVGPQKHRVRVAWPKPSWSSSRFQSEHPTAFSSSTVPSQLSSAPLHSSVAPGLMVALASSQSPPLVAVKVPVAAHRHCGSPAP